MVFAAEPKPSTTDRRECHLRPFYFPFDYILQPFYHRTPYFTVFDNDYLCTFHILYKLLELSETFHWRSDLLLSVHRPRSTPIPWCLFSLWAFSSTVKSLLTSPVCHFFPTRLRHFPVSHLWHPRRPVESRRRWRGERTTPYLYRSLLYIYLPVHIRTSFYIPVT